MRVFFYRRSHGEAESRYVTHCLSTGLETDGLFIKMLTEQWNSLFPDSHALFTTSCTTALEMAVACLSLKRGDEVILPSFNFPAAANAVLLHGGTPILCDIDGDTQNISVKDMMNKISSKTRAVIVMHYAGVACDMEKMQKVVRDANISLIEDAAQGIGAGYIAPGKQMIPLGTMGDFGTVSFHHTKNITCGEGGVLLTGNLTDYRRACQYRLHGTDRALYLAGETDCYTWNMPGSCTAMSELPAAVLASQMEILAVVTAGRRAVRAEYSHRLDRLEKKGMARLMTIPDYAKTNGHMFYLRFETEKLRDHVRDFLTAAEIESKTHYVPLHLSPQGRKMGYREEDLKESAQCGRTLLRLPIHGQMSEEQICYVAAMVLKACGVGR